MDECPRPDGPDIAIQTFPLKVDPDFRHLRPQLRKLLSDYRSLHPLHKNDVGDFPNYEAVLTPALNAQFVQEATRRHDPTKIIVGLEIEKDLLDISIIEPSESPYPCNALLSVKAIPFMTGSNTLDDRHISKTDNKKQDLSEQKWHHTDDQRSHNANMSQP